MGGYDHGQQAGVVHVADHHVVCGAKLWEWGTGPVGRAVGQDPHRRRRPLRRADGRRPGPTTSPTTVGSSPTRPRRSSSTGTRSAASAGSRTPTSTAAVNLEVGEDGKAVLGFNTTSEHAEAKAMLTAERQDALRGGRSTSARTSRSAARSPCPRARRRPISGPCSCRPTGSELIAYQPIERPAGQGAAQAGRARRPSRRRSRRPRSCTSPACGSSRSTTPPSTPTEYYHEALKRDPGDSRCQHDPGHPCCNKRGLLRGGREAPAQGDRAAHRRLHPAQRHRGLLPAGPCPARPAPRGRGLRRLLSRQLGQRLSHACFLSIGRDFLPRRASSAEALAEVNRALATGTLNTKALNLKAAILRRLGDGSEAYGVLRRARGSTRSTSGHSTRSDSSTRTERDKAGAAVLLGRMQTRMRGEVQSYLELATDYAAAGLWDEAIDVLQPRRRAKMLSQPTTRWFTTGSATCVEQQQDDRQGSVACFDRARQLPARLLLPLPPRRDRRPQSGHRRQSRRRPGTLLPRQPALSTSSPRRRWPPGRSRGESTAASPPCIAISAWPTTARRTTSAGRSALRAGHRLPRPRSAAVPRDSTRSTSSAMSIHSAA